MGTLLKYRSAFAGSVAAGMMIVILMLGCPPVAFSGSNTAFDGGGSISLNPSATITVNSVQLALVKQARDLAGTVLAAGANVVPGQTIYFVLYVDNPTGVPAGDIQMIDQLNEAEFTYIADSIETTVVPSGSNDAALWAGAWSPLTQDVGAPDDIVSITDTGGPAGRDRLTVGAVAAQANQQLSISGNTLRAIRFRVTVN